MRFGCSSMVSSIRQTSLFMIPTPPLVTRTYLFVFLFPIYVLLLLFLTCSSLSRGDPLLKVSTDIVNEVVRESTSQLVHATVDEMVQGHMSVIRAGDWLEDFILEAITPMLPRVVCTIYFTDKALTCVVQEDIHTSPPPPLPLLP